MHNVTLMFNFEVNPHTLNLFMNANFTELLTLSAIYFSKNLLITINQDDFVYFIKVINLI